MSPIASPPSASITATSTSTWPRSWTGAKERRAVALESSLVRPVRSASILTAMLPAWATTPLPSADTDNPVDHVVCFTCEVPLSLGHLNSRQVQVSLTRQALSRIQAQCQVTTRERSGLVRADANRNGAHRLNRARVRRHLTPGWTSEFVKSSQTHTWHLVEMSIAFGYVRS